MKSTDNDRKRQKLEALAEQAKAGSKEAVEEILIEIQDMVFNLSLRMLGTIHDAEDASQEILIKVMTHLSGFRGEPLYLHTGNHVQSRQQNCRRNTGNDAGSV